MSDSFIQAPPDSTGKLIDTTELAVGANTVERQRVNIAGQGATDLATVLATPPVGTEPALAVRIVGSSPSPTGAASAEYTSVAASSTANCTPTPAAGTSRTVLIVILNNNAATASLVTLADSGASTVAIVTVPSNATLVLNFGTGFALTVNGQFTVTNPSATNTIDVTVVSA
jgi:hypothetical protein